MESPQRVDVDTGPHQQVARAWVLGGCRSSWGLVLIADTHTDLPKVTDAGLKDFSAALGSSRTITAVKLECRSDGW